MLGRIFLLFYITLVFHQLKSRFLITDCHTMLRCTSRNVLAFGKNQIQSNSAQIMTQRLCLASVAYQYVLLRAICLFLYFFILLFSFHIWLYLDVWGCPVIAVLWIHIWMRCIIMHMSLWPSEVIIRSQVMKVLQIA